MATPSHVEATVSPDGALQIRVPELAPGQRVRVSIEPEETSQVEQKRLRAIDVINSMPGHLEFKCAP